MPYLRFIFRLTVLLCAMVLILPLVLLTILIAQKINNRLLNKNILNLWSHLLCRICGLKVVKKGDTYHQPVLVVANHISWLDIPVIHSYMLVGFVAKAEIAEWPIMGWIVKIGETLFIKRGQQASRKRVLQTIDTRLSEGRSVALFPEGKATDGEQLGRFHRQLMQAAIETQVPIQAIAIKYIKRNGQRNKSIGFKADETFIQNVFRVLSLPSSTVELNFCQEVSTTNKSARETSIITRNQVSKVLAENGYM